MFFKTASKLGAIVLFLRLPQLAKPADLIYADDTAIALTSPAINLTIKAGSSASTVTVNGDNIVVTMPGSATFAVTSASRDLSVSRGSQSTSVTLTCDASHISTATVMTAPNTPDTLTFAPTSAQCPTTPSGGGGGGGGSVVFHPAPAPPPVPSAAPVSAPASYPIGTLVDNGGTINLITAPFEAVAFTSWRAFVGLGYRLQYVISDNLPGYRISTTYFLSSPTQSHPWTSWVRSGHTVYYVSSEGLIGVPSWEIFLSNAGDSKFILPANKADLKVLKANPHLPLLQPNDSRVVR